LIFFTLCHDRDIVTFARRDPSRYVVLISYKFSSKIKLGFFLDHSVSFCGRSIREPNVFLGPEYYEYIRDVKLVESRLLRSLHPNDGRGHRNHSPNRPIASSSGTMLLICAFISSAIVQHLIQIGYFLTCFIRQHTSELHEMWRTYAYFSIAIF